VRSIGSSAFYGCSGLVSVTLPSGVTSIGTSAFLNCTALTSVYFRGNQPTITDTFFTTIVFDGSSAGTAFYALGSTGWSNSFGGWPTQSYNYLPVTNVVLTVEKTSNLSGSWQFDREINIGSTTNTNEFYRLKVGIVVE
jgi:hypothetical protein